MTATESVSRWIADLKAGHEAAATDLWNHFYTRLVAMARRKLRGAPRRAADEEDVVLDAFDSLFRRAKEGRFPKLRDRDDLWRLLITITERKALNQWRDGTRQKRGSGKVLGESAFFQKDSSTNGVGIDRVVGPEPTPEFAAVMTESVQRLLDLLTDDELRKIALLKLEGYTNEEIAAEIHRAVPTVERRLRLIRSKWNDDHS